MKNFTLLLIILSINLSFSSIVNSQQMTDSSKTYIHSEKVSFKSQFFQKMAGIFGVKKIIEKNIRKNKLNQEPVKIPKSIQKNFEIDETNKKGRQIWTLKPKENVSEKVILYLHGGAYYYNISKYNWSFAETIINNTNATIVIPNYPLAPAATCYQVFEYVTEIYNELIEKYSSKNIILLGESAGGGLALGFAMSLQEENKPQPEQLILLAPWLDVTMSNPDILAVDENDKILGIKGLQLAGAGYAGQVELDDYKVSPIYGDLTGLPKVSIFVGTHDILCADVRKLKSKAKESNFSLNYFEYPKMFHIWILLQNLKEAKFAISQITSLINN
ncbi:alpha/beta hydrolase [Tenacibaculum sp. Bg11-29]|uniref:alpha/beta hydrolase n=1 Tax=Tenacibaculum sp. Bg11-29 TaxID=2058306 RepID=UPI000C332862|nr:alpha/beta hydrolase [Tenacibaculum sp. Bg11-29]PKH52079.1 alpha/beta hydrolase [Tenacibaculum sp. Bg11-29]